MRPVHLTFFTSFDRPQAVSEEVLPWPEACTLLSQPERVYKLSELKPAREAGKFEKPGTGFSPALYRGGYKNKQRLELISCIGIEFDGTASWDDLGRWFGGMASVIYSTFNHMYDGRPRFRAVVLLSRDVTAGEYDRIWPQIATMCEGKADSQAKEPSRFWFMPAQIEGRDFLSQIFEGEPLDVDGLLASFREENIQSPVKTGVTSLAYDDPLFSDHVYRFRAHCQNAQPAVSGNSGQNNLLFVANEGVIKLQLPPEVAETIAWETYNPRCAPPWSEEERRSFTRKFLQAAENQKGITSKVEDERIVGALSKKPEEVLCKELDLDAEPRPIPWLVDQIFEDGTVNALVAHPGSMKTWSLYSLALAVSQGVPWLGSYKAEKRNVLILDYETGETRALRRFKILKKGVRGVRGIFYKRNIGSLHKESTWEMVAKIIEKKKIGLVLIDSLSAGSGGVDENVAAFALPLQLAAELSDVGCTFIFIHHAKKGDSKSNEIMRGTSALQASADTIYRFSDPEGSPKDVLRCEMSLAKAGDGEQEVCIRLKLSNDGGLQLDTDNARELSDTSVNLENKTLLALTAVGTKGISGYRSLAKQLGVPNTTAQEVLMCLLEQGKVRREPERDGGRIVFYRWFINV